MSTGLRRLLPAMISVSIALGSFQTLAAPLADVDTSKSDEEISKKRAEPAKVKPVTIGAVRYEVALWGKDKGFLQDSGIIRAIDVRSGAELWLLKVYDIKIDPDMEQDKQEDFIVQLKVAGARLLVKTERGKRYQVDINSRAVLNLDASKGQ